MEGRVLVVEDDPEWTDLLGTVLTGWAFEPRLAGTAAGAREAIEEFDPDVVLLDWRLPDADGLELLPSLVQEQPGLEVVFVSAYATVEGAVEAMKRGAFHVTAKPFRLETLRAVLGEAVGRRRQRRQAKPTGKALRGEPVFRSIAMQAVLRTVHRVAASDASVLITGESGTGKEIIADLIHHESPRAHLPFVKVNCAALPRDLIESELFGAVRGAYTGAQHDREGLFRQATGGTLFLDEIAEMGAETQTKLLRVLQEKEVRPVGGRQVYPVDCRIIAATNQSLEEALAEGRLREDLYYRISALHVELPPLRQRRDDILPLAKGFLRQFATRYGRRLLGFSAAAQCRLEESPWPGNVRELQNVVQRAAVLADGPWVEPTDLRASVTGMESVTSSSAPGAFTPLELAERETITKTLKTFQGNKLAAARQLGIGRQTLYNKLRRYRLEA